MKLRSNKAKFLVLAFSLAALCLHAFGQEIRDQKEAERIYRLSLEQSKYNRLYFDEADRCRKLNSEQKYDEAIVVCKRSIVYAEKLPASRVLERQAGYIQIGIAYLRKRKPNEALEYFEKGFVVGESLLDETDVETGEIYFLIGQAHHIDKNIERASEFYDKAETSVRAAFDEMGEDGDEFRARYPKIVWYILEAHLMLFEEIEEHERAEAIRKRTREFEIAFRKYLDH
ncbi:MAG TPA: tetratricopeptide repeat protein [Pyrinomonadaceae bacterium]|nr:tetratricopeptide repeat protein [Pyrinomonadaceae bacterium]HMP64591.1 tetratricopeptide repeat protein [Pyrinomonadaceae bacterium]